MNPDRERKTVARKTYTRKDGTVVTKEYQQTYLLTDKTEKTLRKKLLSDLKTVSLEQLKHIDAYLNGGGKDRDAGAADVAKS
jgi:hypothetical protein